ncbi:MAG: TetR family transcriptional regulator [Alphaproteobacteria bacterium]|nr:MAG: TetR family transcriptional regulator [Alphaproteobacteria bacterium]
MNASAPYEKLVARTPDRGVARRQAFLQAARNVFLDQGYEAASVNDVVRLAGGSLATLYSQFGNKEGLFLAVIQDEHERLTEAMTPRFADDAPLEQGLQQIGEQFLRTILTRENLAFFRLVVGEGRKFPQSVQRYVFSGADKVREVVANHLRRAAPEFEGDHDIAASYFLELLRSRHQYRALADDTYALSDDDLRQYVAHSVRFLVNGLKRY